MSNKRQIDVVKAVRKEKDLITIDLVSIIDDLPTLYKEVDCRTIDIIVRRFGGVDFDIVIDDEFMLNGKAERVYPTAIYKDPSQEQLFGNLLFCHHDEEGNLTSATYDDLLAIKSAYKRHKDLTMLVYDI